MDKPGESLKSFSAILFIVDIIGVIIGAIVAFESSFLLGLVVLIVGGAASYLTALIIECIGEIADNTSRLYAIESKITAIEKNIGNLSKKDGDIKKETETISATPKRESKVSANEINKADSNINELKSIIDEILSEAECKDEKQLTLAFLENSKKCKNFKEIKKLWDELHITDSLISAAIEQELETKIQVEKYFSSTNEKDIELFINFMEKKMHDMETPNN